MKSHDCSTSKHAKEILGYLLLCNFQTNCVYQQTCKEENKSWMYLMDIFQVLIHKVLRIRPYEKGISLKL